MKRYLLSGLSILIVGAFLGPLSLGAEDPDYPGLLKGFQEGFKAKATVKERRQAVSSLAKAKDGRAVDVLLDTIGKQDKYAAKLRKEWQAEENAWQEKTTRLEKGVTERMNRARERGEDSVSVNEEEAEWLGASGREGKMVREKERIGGLYRGVLEEEGLSEFVYRSIAKVLNALEPADYDKAAAKAVNEAKASTGDRRIAFVKMFGYVKGEKATALLEFVTKDTSTEVIQVALESLGRQNSPRGIDILVARLEDPRWQVRASAITGLSYFKCPRAVDALIARAKKEEGVLVRNYFTALARIVQESVPGTVEAWESWWTQNKEELTQKWSSEPQGEPVIGEPPDIPVDTSLGSTSFYGITTNSKHIIFVVDVSGSMGENGGKNEQGKMRIDVARDELKKAVNSLSAENGDERGEANFNMVIFSTTVEVWKPGKMVDATKGAKEDAMKWIDEKIQPTNMTNIYDAMEQAFNIISATKESKNLTKGADTIYLMSDGAPNRGKFTDTTLILSEIKKLNATRKITIHTIAVGAGGGQGGADLPFMQAMASQNNGQCIAR
jgi:HEAT repeat protein